MIVFFTFYQSFVFSVLQEYNVMCVSRPDLFVSRSLH